MPAKDHRRVSPSRSAGTCATPRSRERQQVPVHRSANGADEVVLDAFTALGETCERERLERRFEAECEFGEVLADDRCLLEPVS